MEQKTIGKFITTLRKASGMTQKELAEKLNVSDKTISRWERDDGAPDLSVIPVLAEIFGVTCDELLRGERKSTMEQLDEREFSAKAEKQRKRILDLSLSRLRARTFVTAGISAAGLIAAMLGNLALSLSFVGFFSGAIFFVAALVCQAVFINSAFFTISDESIVGDELEKFKDKVLVLGKHGITVILTLFATTIPLIILPQGAYMGLTLDSWVKYGAAFGAACWLLCTIISFILREYLLKKGVVAMGKREREAQLHNRKLKAALALALAVVVGVTALGQIGANTWLDPYETAETVEFTDYATFKAYMGKQVEYNGSSGTATTLIPSDPEGDYELVTTDPRQRYALTVSGGPAVGKVVCYYTHRNQTVMYVRTAETEDGLPIQVITHDAYNAALSRLNLINTGFLGLYGAQSLAVLRVYRKKRMRMK